MVLVDNKQQLFNVMTIISAGVKQEQTDKSDD